MSGQACPHCGRRNDLHSHAGEGYRAPSDGDFAICWTCRGIAVFAQSVLGSTLRLPTEDESAAATADPAVRRALGALRESHRPEEAVALLRGEPAPQPGAGAVDPGVIREVLASVRAAPSLERLPCGCEMGEVGDAFVMRPCSPDCEYWRYAMAEAERQGKPVVAYDGDVN